MLPADDRLARLTLVLIPTAIVGLGCGVSLLPRDIVLQAFNVLTAWLTLSVPIGVLFGHCALSESDCP